MYLRFVEGFLSIEKKLHWHYRQYGTGKEVLFCFHGYGFDATQFEVLLPAWQERYSLICFDSFYHGKTAVSALVTAEELGKSIEQFLAEKSIDSFSIAAFSIGCRYCMLLTQLFPKRIQELFLFSPGGLNGNRSFLFAVRNPIGKLLFQRFVGSPGIIFSSINLFQRLGFISEKLKQFSMNNIDTLKKRQQLHRFWHSLEPFYVHKAHFSALVREHKIPIRIFSGTKDGIVPTNVVKSWMKAIPQAELTLVPQGHLLLARNTILSYL